MLIDWFTVGAQAVNFLILVWLLKRFLYKPVLRAIDAREKKIADELADADAQKAEAQKERDEFARKNAEFDQQRAALLSAATDEAKTERRALLDAAAKESEALRARLQNGLQAERRTLGRQIAERTQSAVFAIARKTLADLATASLDERAADVFIRRLRELDGVDKQAMISAIATSPGTGRLRSAFDLPQQQRSAIEAAVKDTLGAAIQLDFETAPDLVGGIELTVNGQKLAWSIADYLASLEKSVADVLEKQPEAKSAPESLSQQRAAEHVG